MLKVCCVVMLAGILAAYPELEWRPSSQESAEKRETRRRPVSMCLVLDGSQGWFSAAAGSVGDIFRTSLGPDTILRIAEFDREADRQHGPDSHLPLLPRTPFREAIQACVDELGSAPSSVKPVIVAVVHEESYPSWLSTPRLVESVQKSEIRVYSIKLAREVDYVRPGLFRRFGRMLVRASTWLGDELFEGPGSTYRQTSDLLSALSSEVCAASNEQVVRSCANEICKHILKLNP